MTVIVTGAAGFIGRHLVRALVARGHHVAAVDRRPGSPAEAHTTVTADLADGGENGVADLLRAADVVFHLAASSGVRGSGPDVEARRRRDNVEASRVVLDAVPLDVPVIVTSSSAVYGGSRGRPSAESDAPCPRGGYARSKLEVERLCARRVSHGGHVAVVRPFTVAGEGQRPDMAISRWISAARRGRPLQIYGSPGRTRDITDVSDVVEGLLRIADRGVRATVNIGTGRGWRLDEIVAAVADATGTEPRTAVRPASSEEAPATLADTTRCHRLLGFTPHTELAALVARQAGADVSAAGMVVA